MMNLPSHHDWQAVAAAIGLFCCGLISPGPNFLVVVQSTVAGGRRAGLAAGPHRDIQRKLAIRPDLFLVGVIDGQVVASVMAGYEGHRGWLNYLAIAPGLQRRGYARVIVAEAERLLRAAGCLKVNLQVRASNRGVIEFYHRLGYAVDDVVSMGKRLEHDDRVS